MSRHAGFYRAARVRRFLRPDAHRWIRPDVAKFLKFGVDPADVYPALAQQRDALQRQRDREIGEAIAHERALLDELRRELAEIKSHLVRRRIRREAEAKYSASQPRVPAGQTDGGRWSSRSNAGSLDGGVNDPQVISDADPEGIVPGADYAYIIPVCIAGSSSRATDYLGNKTFRVTYECVGGRSFTISGGGHNFPGIVRDRFR